MTTFLSTIVAVLFVFSCTRRTCLAEPLWSNVCTDDESKNLPFCDIALGLDERISDYVNRVPVEIKISMMGHNASGYEALKIPPYMWWSEGLHGPLEPCVQHKDRCVCPTIFPSPSAMGNAFNRTLYRLVGQTIGIQGRAISNLRVHNQDIGDGLTYWCVNGCLDANIYVGVASASHAFNLLHLQVTHYQYATRSTLGPKPGSSRCVSLEIVQSVM